MSDAVRPALPALERTIAALAGRSLPADAAPAASEARRLIAQRSGGAPFGSGDLARFFEQLRLGDAYNNIGDPVNAERAYREALAIQQRILGPNDPGLALTMMKLGAQFAHQGNRREAERLLANAAALTARQPDPLLVAQLDFYRATAAAYNANPEEATRYVQRAETEFARLAPEALGRSRPRTRNRRRGRAGWRWRSAGARPTGPAGTDVVANSEERAAALGLAETMRLHATLLQFSGRMEDARALARRAEQLLAGTGLSYSSTGARSLRLIASNQAVARDYPAAVGTSGEAGRIFERITPRDRPAALNLLSRGYYLLQTNRLDAALDSFRKAGEILRSPMVSGGVNAELILPWLDALERAPGGTAQNAAEMFEAAQLARGGQTAQDIARATAALTAESPQAAEAVRSFEERKARVDQLERERVTAEQEKAPGDAVNALDQQIEEAVQAQREAEAAILAAAPRYAQAAEKPVPAADFQRLLAADEALAFLFIGDTGGYGFFVRPNGLTAYRIPLSSAQVTELVTQLRNTTVAQPGGLPTPDFAVSYRLYAALFGPVEQQFAGVRKISVSATGDLLRYPLEALVTQPGATDNNGDFRQVPFLVRRVALAYVPAPASSPISAVRAEHRVRGRLSGSAISVRPAPGSSWHRFHPIAAATITGIWKACSPYPPRARKCSRLDSSSAPVPATSSSETSLRGNGSNGPICRSTATYCSPRMPFSRAERCAA